MQGRITVMFLKRFSFIW